MGADLNLLREIEQRVLWLAVRIVDYANRERPAGDGLKVGGHQASSASMTTLMTALYFASLDERDRISVKPHAAPVLHAIEYLLGRLDRSYLTRLRDFGGLQSYPSRTKDPFIVDYSTGSVGLGSAAPLFGAIADRYLASKRGCSTGGRFISILGDAELDEGNLWEAVNEPLGKRLGNVLWIVDLNRQSLDRVVPGMRAEELQRQFAAVGWHVIELKYGRRLREAFLTVGGHLLRRRLDEMPNEEYQALFAQRDDSLRAKLLEPFAGEERRALASLLDSHTGRCRDLIADLGGHDFADILAALDAAREVPDRPTVIFAYTIKGRGLEIAGRPHNHSALLSAEQIDRLRAACGLIEETEWDAFAEESPTGVLIANARNRLERDKPPAVPLVDVPTQLAATFTGTISTQAALGRILLELSRLDALGDRLVTVSPDVAISTNLGGLINKVGVWNPEPTPAHDAMDDSPLRWRVGPHGRHIELGIAEMNTALLLGQLSLTAEAQGERLFPLGTLYDPFVMRALEGIVYSVYSGGRFILCGTPSGISLSREGGAHQSINTPGIGIETPALTYAEPAYAKELEWLLLDGLRRLQAPAGDSLYLRLSTTPLDQTPFASAIAERGEEALRADVVAGGFRLRTAGLSEDRVLIATCGPLVVEALAAANRLAEDEGVEATVLCLSAPGRLYRDWQRACSAPVHSSTAPRLTHVHHLLGADRGLPIVTAVDGASHALAWLGSASGANCVPLGVDQFGQTGSQPELYEAYGVSADAMVLGALAALDLEQR